MFTIAVAPQSKFKSAHDLITAARENPGKLTYGHAGTGTIPHLAMENFAEALKLKFQPVPFRGDAPVLPTLLKGDIDFGASAVSTIHGQNFRPLLVFWQARHPAYPDVPIARELGAASDVPPGHNGLYAPGGLPGAIKTALERHCADADEEQRGSTDASPIPDRASVISAAPNSRRRQSRITNSRAS